MKQISFTVQLVGLHIIMCYDVTNSPEPVRPVSRVRFDRVGDVFLGQIVDDTAVVIGCWCLGACL